MDLGLDGQGGGDHRRQRRHRPGGGARGLAAEGVHLVLIAAAIGRALAERAREIAAEIRHARAGHRGRRRDGRGLRAGGRRGRREFGGCDILINNAGTGSNETILEAPDEKWQPYWDLHVMAAVRLARGLRRGWRRAAAG